jgi:uncharacterized protein (UPF0332 family)
MMISSTYIEKALRALTAAQILLDRDDAEGACNRAYYAMFNAAHAALATLEIEISEVNTKSHRGLIAAFGKYVINENHIDAKFGRIFNRAERLRLIADYTGDIITLEYAKLAVEQAHTFIEAIIIKFELEPSKNKI